MWLTWRTRSALSDQHLSLAANPAAFLFLWRRILTTEQTHGSPFSRPSASGSTPRRRYDRLSRGAGGVKARSKLPRQCDSQSNPRGSAPGQSRTRPIPRLGSPPTGKAFPRVIVLFDADLQSKRTGRRYRRQRSHGATLLASRRKRCDQPGRFAQTVCSRGEGGSPPR